MVLVTWIERRRRAARSERGAAAAIAAITTMLLVLSAAFAADLGTQRVVRSDSQALADVVALDLGNDLRTMQTQGCAATATYNSDGTFASCNYHTKSWFVARWNNPVAASPLSQSLARNNTVVGSADPSNHAGWVCSSQSCVVAVPGYIDPTVGVFTTIGGSGVPNAVQVTASGKTKFLFVPGMQGSATRTAVGLGTPIPPKGCSVGCTTPPQTACTVNCSPCAANPAACSYSDCTTNPALCPSTCATTPALCPPGTSTPQSACYEVGSYAASISTNKSALLNALTNNITSPSLNLSAVALGYNGLATAGVDLGDLATALGVGSVSSLATANVSEAQLLTAMATVLSNQVPQNTAVASVLNNVVAANSSLSGKMILFSNVVNLGSGASVADAQLNVLDMLTGSLEVMNGSSFASIPGLTLSLPAGLTNVSVQLQVIDKPQIACNGATASTSQVALKLTANANLGGLLGLSNVSMTLNMAKADVTLNKLNCVATSPTGEVLNVANPGLVTTQVHVDVLSLLGLPLASVDTSVGPTSTVPTQATLNLDSNAGTAYYAPTWYHVPNTPSPIAPVTNTNVSVLGVLPLPLGTLVSSVNTTVIGGLNTLLTSSAVVPTDGGLEGILGLNLAGVDLTVPNQPTCPVVLTN